MIAFPPSKNTCVGEEFVTFRALSLYNQNPSFLNHFFNADAIEAKVQSMQGAARNALSLCFMYSYFVCACRRIT